MDFSLHVPAGADLAKTLRAEMLDALKARAAGELPDKGPRGGKRWGVIGRASCRERVSIDV